VEIGLAKLGDAVRWRISMTILAKSGPSAVAQRNTTLVCHHSGIRKDGHRHEGFLLDTRLSSSPFSLNSTRHSVTIRIASNSRLLCYLIFSTRHLNATLEKRNRVEKFNTWVRFSAASASFAKPKITSQNGQSYRQVVNGKQRTARCDRQVANAHPDSSGTARRDAAFLASQSPIIAEQASGTSEIGRATQRGTGSPTRQFCGNLHPLSALRSLLFLIPNTFGYGKNAGYRDMLESLDPADSFGGG
jgi:hypothetical protein